MGMLKTGVYNPLPVVPIVLVGANVNGKPNYAAVGFVNGVNYRPAVMYVGLSKNHHTTRGLLENGTFSINVPSEEYVVETDYCGLVSGKSVDKSAVFNTFYGELGSAPMIADFPITCECRYTGQQVEFEMDTVYFGEVVQVYVNEAVAGENGRLDTRKANPLLFAGLENRYRAMGADMGEAWRVGRQYQPTASAVTSCALVERPTQPALAIRSRVEPAGMPAAIGECAAAIYQYALQKGRAPTGALFVAYHGLDGSLLDVEIGLPFETSMEGNNRIIASPLPGGQWVRCLHVGPYDHLPQARVALEQWLKANGRAAAGPRYECYLNDPQSTAPEKLETEILIPLHSAC